MFPLGSSGAEKVTFTRFTSSGISDNITFLGGSFGSEDDARYNRIITIGI